MKQNFFLNSSIVEYTILIDENWKLWWIKNYTHALYGICRMKIIEEKGLSTYTLELYCENENFLWKKME